MKNSIYFPAITQTTLFSLIFLFLAFLADLLLQDIIGPWTYGLVIYLAITYMAGFCYFEYKTLKNPDNFSKYFFIVMALRILASLALITLIIIIDREDAARSAITFVILYLCYLAFEIYYLIRIFQPRIGKGTFNENRIKN